MNIIKAFWEIVDGHKTDLLVLAGIALWLGVVFEWWTYEQVEMLPPIIGILGIATFRDALRKA